MPKKYIAPIVILIIVTSIISFFASRKYIQDPETFEPIKYNKAINIRPESYNGTAFEKLDDQTKKEYFKFEFDPEYFNQDSIDTFDPIETNR